MNLGQAIDRVTGHIDPDRVRMILLTELACGCTVEELLTIHRVSLRRHEGNKPLGQGKHAWDPR